MPDRVVSALPHLPSPEQERPPLALEEQYEAASTAGYPPEMNTQDLIEQAVWWFRDAYRKSFPAGGDAKDHDDATWEGIEAVVVALGSVPSHLAIRARALADEASRAVVEPRRFMENEGWRQQALGQAISAVRHALRGSPSPEQVREDTDAVEAAAGAVAALYERAARPNRPIAAHVATAAVEAARPHIVAEALREVEEALRAQGMDALGREGDRPLHRGIRYAADFIHFRFRAGGESG